MKRTRSSARDGVPTVRCADSTNAMAAPERAARDFAAALEFARSAHAPDLAWIERRANDGLVHSFADFYDEYTYVVLASGFRAKTAAALAPRLVACRGRLDDMLAIFRNAAKCRALADTWQRWGGADERDWSERLRPLLAAATAAHDVAAAAELLRTHLSYIGPVTKLHLARNLGIDATAVKPDLHLVRYAVDELGYALPRELVDDIMRRVPLVERPARAGAVDFVLWLWLAHGRGARDPQCCDGARRLR